MTPIYLDNAASTRPSDDVLALYVEVARSAWGNPSAQHPQGAAARDHIARARERLVRALGGAGDVIWTSGCTEANALGVIGAARTRASGAIVMTTLEHPAIATLADRLASEGREVVRVAPDRDGVIDPEAIARAAAGAAVVAIVMVQNEIGIVQPIAQIAAAVRRAAPGCHIHVDGAQAFGKVPIDAAALGVDSIAIAGHKLHAVKGVGALWVKAGARVEPIFVGGGQQAGRRGGTQDAPGAAALGLAAERAAVALPSARARWLELAARATEVLAARGVAWRQLVPDVRRAPHILALGIAAVPAAAMRTVLASRGVYVSTGSSCNDASGGVKASPALEAIGLPADVGMVRLSFGADTTAAEVEAAAGTIADVARELSSTGSRA